MSYLGNPSLAQDVQDRITNTFQQTLGLVTQGKEQEALVGCEFILRMDPAFQPAQTLLERLKSPERPVEVDDLRDGGAPAAAPEPADARAAGELDEPGDLDELSELDDLKDLEGLDELDLEDERAPAAPASGLAAVVQDLLEKRNFEQVLQIAENQKAAVEQDPRVQEMVEVARARLESDAYVQAFLRAARQAQDAGQLDEMESNLAKARALDPEHPDVLGFVPAPPAAAPPAAAPPAAAPADGEMPSFAEEETPAAAGDEDLRALQEQSLALDTAAADDAAAGGPEDLDAELAEFSFETGEEAAPAAPAGADDSGGEPPFEEDLVEGLELPDAEPPDAAASGEIPAIDDAEGGERIAQLLAEGQEIYERGEYQAAIDVWSRIFLIDIDNAEASSRIDKARNKKAELERQGEEVFHEGVGHIEQESLDAAKESFRRVLEIEPSHTLAREYLEQLEAGQVPVITAGDVEAPDLEALGDAEFAGVAEAVTEASPSLEAAVERDRIVVVKKANRLLIAVGAAGSLLAIGGILFLANKWDDLFPNREAPQAVVRQTDPIERATKMHEAGNTEIAINQLKRIPPQDPLYEDAQALIAQWKALVEAPPEELPSGPSEEQVQRLNLLLDAARKAHAQRQYIRASKYFDRASKIVPLEAADLELKREGEQALTPLEPEIQLFRDGEYTQVIPILWRKRDAEPDNPDIELLLVDSYYNLALRDLQRGDALAAFKKLQDALEVAPDNQELERMRLFAQTYVDRPQDLLYRIFVKYLPSRTAA